MASFPAIIEEEEDEDLPPEELMEEEAVVAAAPVVESAMSLPIPAGFKIPGNKPDGEVFEVIAKMRKQGDRLIVDTLDGYEGAAKPAEPVSPNTDEENDAEFMSGLERMRR